jgi:hypothetical protein
MNITVTQDHIDKGVVSSCALCPVSLALLAIGYEQVTVFLHLCSFLSKAEGKIFHCKLPTIVTDFIVKYDKREPVSPFSFQLIPHDVRGISN